MMREVVQFLEENPVQYVATVGLDGRPKVRPFQFMTERDGKLYFCTSNQKEVYAQLQKNPYIEICTASKDSAWIRISGRVVFSGDLALKREIVDAHPLVRSIYQTGDNPAFEIFYLEDGEVVLSDFSGNPPRIIKL